jgi:DNA invertase Pin-like site-specific DNA recombinase
VIVDDLSRLSRDIGDTHAIVFGELAGAGVKVLDTHGLDSEADSGEMTVAMRSIINREYIRGVAKQTHRGLEGRALAGFSTGGSQYGYKTITEPNPPIPDRPRKLWVKSDDEAKIILRMFQEYDEGASGYKAIAEALNDDGVPAPRDHRRAKGNKHGGGWSAGTVRAILTNRRYIGEWAWNTTKWTRTNGKVKRRSRPKADHVVKVIPELAIVPRDLFDRVQARLARVNRIGTHGGRPAGAGQRPYLVSGLLKCSSCGGPMSVHGQTTKNGVRYANFACTANRSRGASVCANSSSISEK